MQELRAKNSAAIKAARAAGGPGCYDAGGYDLVTVPQVRQLGMGGLEGKEGEARWEYQGWHALLSTPHPHTTPHHTTPHHTRPGAPAGICGCHPLSLHYGLKWGKDWTVAFNDHLPSLRSGPA